MEKREPSYPRGFRDPRSAFWASPEMQDPALFQLIHCIPDPEWNSGNYGLYWTGAENHTQTLAFLLGTFYQELIQSWACLVTQRVKNPPAVQETWIWSLSWGDPLEEGMAIHSSILAWRIPTDRGAPQATVPRVAETRAWLSKQSRAHLHYRQDWKLIQPLWRTVRRFLKELNT